MSGEQPETSDPGSNSDSPDSAPVRPVVLFVGAHHDDVELGCGGIIAQYGHLWDCHAMVMTRRLVSSDAILAASRILGYRIVDEFYSASSPAWLSQVEMEHCTKVSKWRRFLAQVNHNLKPKYIFVVERDSHPDHQACYDAVTTYFRHQTIYAYSPHRRDPSAFVPNMWLTISGEALTAKIESLEKYREEYDQIHGPRRYLQGSVIAYTAGVDGLAADTSYAEAFRVVRQVNFPRI